MEENAKTFNILMADDGSSGKAAPCGAAIWNMRCARRSTYVAWRAPIEKSGRVRKGLRARTGRAGGVARPLAGAGLRYRAGQDPHQTGWKAQAGGAAGVRAGAAGEPCAPLVRCKS